MIIKSIGRKALTGGGYPFLSLLQYITKHHFEPNNPDTFIFRHNVPGKDDLQELAMQFTLNEQFRARRAKNQILARHFVISFHCLDRASITTDMLKQVLKEFVRVYDPKGMYVASAHYDRSHVHLHAMVGTIQYKHSQNLRQTKAVFKAMKISLEEFQRTNFPTLIHSLNDHNKGKDVIRISDAEHHLLQRGKVSNKEKLKEKIDYVMNISASIGELKEHLRELGIVLYERGSKVYGVVDIDGRRHRFGTLGYQEKIRELEEYTREELNVAESLQKFRRSKSYDRELS